MRKYTMYENRRDLNIVLRPQLSVNRTTSGM